MSRRKKKPSPAVASGPASAAPRRSRLALWLSLTCVLLAILAAWVLKREHGILRGGIFSAGAAATSKFALQPQAEVFASYAGSAACRDCHQQAFTKWQGSHHGLAERLMESHLDRPAFDPPKQISIGAEMSQARLLDGSFQLITAGAKSAGQTFLPARVIGVDPVRQFLVPAQGGRWQATELAWDPNHQQWFDVFGNEQRQPGEWGHWTGRGMTWNQMCASCHNTRVRKNYDTASDSYHTAMAAMTVGCESCHGPMRAHAESATAHAAQSRGSAPSTRPPRPDPAHASLSSDQMLDTCGMCHARRTELTGDFAPGDKFCDHFALAIPDESDLFYPDGQVHEEDYEFTAFLGSKMHAAGVRCVDCHDPHTAKTALPGNALCLRCHGSGVVVLPSVAVAPKIIDPDHSFHRAGTPGSRCVDCHMPETVYMQRHARRDHGFTIPDPLLTKEYQVPNACGRCHADKPVDWAIENCDKWYGEKMNRPTRARAMSIAAARSGAAGAEKNLVSLIGAEKIPLWRAVAVNLLRNDRTDKEVSDTLLSATKDSSDLVRSMAARALGGMESPTGDINAARLTSLLGDRSRAVRIEAAWALRKSIDTAAGAGSELLHYLNFNRDQPSGLTQWAGFLDDRGDSSGALAAYRQAVEWDGGSAPLRSNYAIALSKAGQPGEAADQLGEAVRLAPQDARMRYTYALALNEAHRAPDALQQLQETVRLDPRFGRAWYNLGLARNAAGQAEAALAALSRAEEVDPGNALAPYAAATIYTHLQRYPEAIQAARRALKTDPQLREAADLLRALPAEHREHD